MAAGNTAVLADSEIKDGGNFVISAKSSGFNGDNLAQITIDNVPVEMEKNESGGLRGLHLVVINP